MLSQIEADALLLMSKKRTTDEQYEFPLAGSVLKIPIVSTDGRHTFDVDINRGRIRLTKCTYQERHHSVIVLARLDVDGPTHTNPFVPAVPIPYLDAYNGATIPCPHLHQYVAGYMDRWAIPAPASSFPRTGNIFMTLDDFFAFCKVTEPPDVVRGLFA
jgi:hypothetical protein